MKNLPVAIFICIFLTKASCTYKLHSHINHSSSVIDLFKDASQKDMANKGRKHSLNLHIYERRMEAARLFNIETDTSKLSSFIVIDIGNLEGADYFSEVTVNDSFNYCYSSSYSLSDTRVIVKKTQDNTFVTEKTKDLIFDYLKAHRFTELEALADKKGKTLSGSGFYCIGMYEKGMDSVYVKLIPAFIIN